MKAREIPLIGVAFIGEAMEDSERTICAMGGVKRLGRLPSLDPLTSDGVAKAFAENFCASDFLQP